MTGESKPVSQEGKAPFALAMIICDAIWRDPSTGKRTLLGCFSAIFSPGFPVRCPVMGVYIAITDGHGKTSLTLRMVDVDEESPPVFELKGEADFADPRMILELDFAVMNAVFPQAGEYRLQLFAGTHPIMERRIVLASAPVAKGDSDAEPQDH
jgi:hypothetical protein